MIKTIKSIPLYSKNVKSIKAIPENVKYLTFSKNIVIKPFMIYNR